MQLMLGVLKKKLKHDLKHDVEELDLPQATTASRILKDRSPDVTLLRAGSREGGLPRRSAAPCFNSLRWSPVEQISSLTT
jgi:hypothetical protein